MKKTLFLILCFFCFNAHAESFTMRCEVDDLSKEAVRIKSLAPNIVLRKNKTLMIRVAKKTIKYQDNKPADQFDEIYYRFCDRKNGYILIESQIYGDNSGQLIVEQTGEELDAGYTVIFSPDHKAYFSYTHPGGRDGDIWKIHFADTGITSYEGSNYIYDSSKTKNIIAWLSDPKWTDRGELVATANCLDPEKHIPPEFDSLLSHFFRKALTGVAFVKNSHKVCNGTFF